jgi:hypothetical protein
LNQKQWLEKYKLCSKFVFDFFEKLNIIFRIFRKIIFRKIDNLYPQP